MDTERVAKALVDGARKYIDQRFASLEKRIAELEARPAGLKYAGTYDEGRRYMPGEIVTDHGSAWHCREATTQRPGQSKAWQLMVKKGRDSR